MRIEHLPESVFIIHDFLSENECLTYIEHAERLGFHQASVHHPRNGPLMLKDIRNNDRVNFEDEALAKQLFSKAQNLLPLEIEAAKLCGINHQFRFYRYETGQYFKWHRDGYATQGKTDASRFTFLLYLNDDYLGGETEFRWGKVRAARGMALVFPHTLVHQGAAVVSGTKYVLRTDVMYRTKS